MPEHHERVQYYGVWRMRIRRLALAVCCVSFTTVTSAPAPAAAAGPDGLWVPICTNGAITYILMSFDGPGGNGPDGNDLAPPPDAPFNGSPAACHGPCLHERKRPLTEK